MKIPSYRYHSSGNARVTIGGKAYYLGKYDSPESREKYVEIIREYLKSGGQVPLQKGDRLSISEMVERYLAHAKIYYRKNGRLTTEVGRVKSVGNLLLLKHPQTLAEDFGPKALKAVRDAMIDKGWTRKFINSAINLIRRMFRYAASEEWIPADVCAALETVEHLHQGRSQAKESIKIRPAPESSIEAIRPHLRGPIRGLMELQLLTGMRPGEVVLVRGCDIDRDGWVIAPDGGQQQLPGIWVYVPHTHKTEHHDLWRVILIGPKGQELLKPYLESKEPEEYLFSPLDAVEEQAKERRATRVTPLIPSHLKRYAKQDRTRNRNKKYSPATYDRAIRRICEEKGIPLFSPRQLRKNAGTRIGSEFGPEIARIILGHTTVNTTKIYMFDDLSKAAEAARKAG